MAFLGAVELPDRAIIQQKVSSLGVKQLQIDVNEVTVGMYVSGLDRPWTQTPFPLQGFYVQNLEQISELKSICRYVYIDVTKGDPPVKARLRTLSRGKALAVDKKSRQSNPAHSIKVAPLKPRHNHYPQPQGMNKEIHRAKELHNSVFSAMSSVAEQLMNKEAVDLQDARNSASDMVDSVVRNPDAFSWLNKIQETDQQTYSHSVRSAVWAIIFGRHYGMSKSELDILALGVLLKDVGKTQIPSDLINMEHIPPELRDDYEAFVDIGVELLRKTGHVPPRVVSVVKTHCERLDGSGFPEGLAGDRIPLLGKIAGIVTYYDQVTNPRGAAYPLPPSKAIGKLYETRDKWFQEELVVEFIRAIGLYPTGTLVELNTGEVAVVIEQNFRRRLKPKVLIVADSGHEMLPVPVEFDLEKDHQDKQKLIDEGKLRRTDVDHIDIVRDLQHDSFPIDFEFIKENYLFKAERRSLKSALSLFRRKRN